MHSANGGIEENAINNSEDSPSSETQGQLVGAERNKSEENRSVESQIYLLPPQLTAPESPILQGRRFLSRWYDTYQTQLNACGKDEKKENGGGLKDSKELQL